MEINTTEYCNISDIIDISKTNQNLSSYNIQLVDGYNFKFKIEKVLYGNTNYNIDITSEIMQFDKKLIIPANTNINAYKGDPYEHFKRQYFIEINGPRSLVVTYSIDNVPYQQVFAVLPNGLLVDNVDVGMNDNLEFMETKMFCNDGSDIFRTFVKTIVFNETVIGKSNEFIKMHVHIKPQQKINAIHLRIEDDAIQHWGTESKFTDLALYKKLVELRYIDIIKRIVSKDDLTILLASDYNNGVVDFMRENSYNYIVTPKFSPHRDVSAIIDMHIGQHCNNLCLGIWESSYSYAMFFRIFNKTNLTTAILYLTNIEHQGAYLDNTH